MAWSLLYKHTLDVVGKVSLRSNFQALWWVSPVGADGHPFGRAVACTHALGGHCSLGCNTTASRQAGSKSELICFHRQSWLSNLVTEYLRGRVMVWLNVREANHCKRDTCWSIECFLLFSQQFGSCLHTLPWSYCSLQIGSSISFFPSALAKCESVYVSLRVSLQISETWSPRLWAHSPLK